jgi:hypothetical protein
VVLPAQRHLPSRHRTAEERRNKASGRCRRSFFRRVAREFHLSRYQKFTSRVLTALPHSYLCPILPHPSIAQSERTSTTHHPCHGTPRFCGIRRPRGNSALAGRSPLCGRHQGNGCKDWIQGDQGCDIDDCCRWLGGDTAQRGGG